MEEHQTKPNITLRYSERYYPDSFYQDDRQERQEYQDRPRNPVSLRHFFYFLYNIRLKSKKFDSKSISYYFVA